MLTVDIGQGSSVNMRFQHAVYQREIPMSKQMIGSRACICNLKLVHPDESEELYIGIAKCHENDNYCRETGRKISLTRAMQNSTLSKHERRLVWEAYLGRKEKVQSESV